MQRAQRLQSIAVVAASAIAAMLVESSDARGDTIQACVNKSTGAARILIPGLPAGAASCSASEKALQWNVSGSTGPAGATGATGPAGLQGPAGPPGAPGPQGANGAPGATGATGAAGPQGVTGPQGATGAPGADGLAGPMGPMGPMGPQGQVGPAGQAGGGAPSSVLCPACSLAGASLAGANLQNAFLSNADLKGADLAGANLSGANLSGALLLGANLTGANLSHATLTNAVLGDVDLTGADLTGADLTGAFAYHDTAGFPKLDGVTWGATICPDGLLSDGSGTCANDFGEPFCVTEEVIAPAGNCHGSATDQDDPCNLFACGLGFHCVLPAKVLYVELLPHSVSLAANVSTQLTALAHYSDGGVVDVTYYPGLTWSVADASLFTVSTNGLVTPTGAAAGNTTKVGACFTWPVAGYLYGGSSRGDRTTCSNSASNSDFATCPYIDASTGAPGSFDATITMQ